MPKKIFELAKELEMGAIDLVEKLKADGFSVRNHMASLSDEDVEKVMASFAPSQKKGASKKKKVTRRKAAKKTTKKVSKKTAKEASDSIDEKSAKKAAKKVTKNVIKKAAKKVTKKAAGKTTTKAAENSETQELAQKEASKKRTKVLKKKGVTLRKAKDVTPPPESTEFQEFQEFPRKEDSSSPEASENAEGRTPRKTVIRRRASSDLEKAPSSENEELSFGSEQEGEKISSGQEREKEGEEERRELTGSESLKEAFGLRVVSRPKKDILAEQREDLSEKGESSHSESPDSKKSEKVEGDGLFREKVHKFTPVFIPKKEESKETSSPKGEGKESSGETEDSGDKKERESKKRLGGLASMMSGKKGASRSQVLNQTRADTELKSYNALSGTGRPVYTQVKRKKIYSGPSQSTQITEVKESKRIVKLHGGATAIELAKKLKTKLKEMVDRCLDLNLLLKGEDYIGVILATEIANLYGYRIEDVSFDEEAVIGKEDLSEEEKEKLPLRHPVVAIMGHVDHGKTTLLDYIRNEKVASGEAGGITQHIGAYSVKTKSAKGLTFLDTPGHAAFANMRQRGANITDIVILVVAADDGVMPQTRESIKFIQKAQSAMIVAINKMDKEGANADRVKNELTEFGITPEEWGGETQMVPISALNGDGIDDLLEAVALLSEMMELRADPKGAAHGVVIESKVEPGRGPVATVLVQSGTLKKGDSLVSGESYGRARGMLDSTGKQLKLAGPSTPVQILGLNEAPSPGDSIDIVKNEREAKKIVQNRMDERKKLENMPKKNTISLEDFFATPPGEGVEQKKLNIIVRSDVQGSFEAIKQSLEALTNSEVEVKLIGGGVGPISDSDIQLADASEGIIIGFNMRPVTSARRLSEEKGIEVRTYSIIYKLIDDVKLALEGMLDPKYVEKYIGRVEVKETFVVPRVGVIAGSVVIDGSIQVGCQVRLLREGKIIFDGKMSSLKRFKDDVKEVKSGYECGVGLEGFNDVKIGDLFEAYIMEEKKRSLEDIVKSDAALSGEGEVSTHF